jgi:hypothetical protein
MLCQLLQDCYKQTLEMELASTQAENDQLRAQLLHQAALLKQHGLQLA